MKNISFNKILFIKTISIFLILNIIWTSLCVIFNEFTDSDKGLITGLGYLVLLPVSIYFGQGLRRTALLGYLVILTILVFLCATFVLGPLIILASNLLVLYAVINSVFVAIVMTLFLNRIVRIEFKIQTILLTSISLICGYLIIGKFSENLNLDYDFHPRLTMFNVFQFALIIPLTIGMTIKKVST